MIRLSAGDWSAEILPELGGSIARLDRRGRAVFRPAAEGVANPLETGCFPLVPYANRIDRGRFRWRGREVVLAPTPGFEPHALHGSGWRNAWTVLETTAASARLEFRSRAGDWPWAWRAEQTIALDDEGLRVALSLTNQDTTPMPGGLGLHPYFATGPGDRVRLEAPSVWVGETLIPDRLAPAAALLDWREGVERSRAPFIDNAYDGWTGVAEVIGADRTVRLASAATRLHIYAPEGETFVCLEPMSHRPNALNAPEGERSGQKTLAPGQTMSLSMRITEQRHMIPIAPDGG